MKHNIILVLFLFLSPMVHAESETISIKHAQFSEMLNFNVMLPPNYEKNGTKSYILLFDFHPRANIYLNGMHDWLSHNGEWPWLETIIVTPAFGNSVGVLFDETGKTTPLLDFFENMLFPELDRKYRTNGFRIMSGFRVNATIVLSALINKPEMINVYLATSPQLSDNYAGILSTAANKLKILNDKPRFLYFTHGDSIKEETQQESYYKFQMILKSSSPKSLEWHQQSFNENYFMSMPLLTTILGIEKLFNDIHSGLEPTSLISQQGIPEIVKHYKYLSKEKYGFEVSPKKSIENRGLYLLKNSHEQGIILLKEATELFPDDAYSYHNLARGYAEIGDYENAVLQQKIAVSKSKTMLTWHRNRMFEFLDTFTRELTNK
ncbi:MAG: hypothetical protein JKY14_06450 [Paraglaciecola sp.]|nr:hypothetical protein [Paraglaciecola sp.]